MSGSCLTMASLCPDAKISAEPSGRGRCGPLAAGELIPQTGPDTTCDGLLTSLGELTWPIRDHLETIVTVSDDRVVEASG